jgi:signal transduction histidine kinase
MTLRRRVMTALVSLVVLFTVIQGGISVMSLSEQEDELVDELVLAETHRLALRIAESGPSAIGNSLLPEDYEAWWVNKSGSMPRPLPEELKRLTDGPHLVSSPVSEYHIMVLPVADGRLYVRYNAFRNEDKIRAFAVQVFILALVFIGLAVWIARHVTAVLIAPLEKVAQLLDNWAPASEPGEAPPVDEEQRVLKAFERVQARWELGLARENERLSDIHHEIRTPLTALRTDLEILQSLGLLNGVDRSSHASNGVSPSQRLERSLIAIDAITGALESMRALRSGQTSPAEPVLLTECIDDAWASLGDLPEKRALTKSNEISRQVLAVVDRQALMAILRNLFRNAAEHAAPAKLRITYANAHLIIADDGPGIPEEERAFVFDRYYRGRLADAPALQDANHSATDFERGLGLAIARQIADANGWQLRIAAAAPRGTQFSISFKESQMI